MKPLIQIDIVLFDDNLRLAHHWFGQTNAANIRRIESMQINVRTIGIHSGKLLIHDQINTFVFAEKWLDFLVQKLKLEESKWLCDSM